MKLKDLLPQALLLLTCLAHPVSAARKPANSVLLSSVKTLTLREGKETSAKRVSPIPQLKCVGGNAKGLYNVDVMRCENSGSDYEENDVQWTCKATIPPEFRLGSTDVMCEGYDSPGDPYILKGSCGVEYRLVLTEAGEEKYGHREEQKRSPGPSKFDSIMGNLCLLFIVCVVAYGVWNCYTGDGQQQGQGPRVGRRGGGGGGGWGGDDGGDPPPPYTPHAPYRAKPSQASGDGNWRPGFYTGAAAGGAAGYGAGYMAGNRNTSRRDAPTASSARSAQGGGPSSPAPSSSRYESTGFGATSRR